MSHSSSSSGSSSTCLFCLIVSGSIPCSLVHSTALSYSFLDISPLSFGHTLVIPRRHSDSFLDLTGDEIADLFSAAQLISRAVQTSTGCDGFNLIQNNGAAAGQSVFHSHLHIVPRFTGDGLLSEWRTKNYESVESRANYLEEIKKSIGKISAEKSQ